MARHNRKRPDLSRYQKTIPGITYHNGIYFNNRCYLYSGECVEDLYIMFPGKDTPILPSDSKFFAETVKLDAGAKDKVLKLIKLARHIFEGDDISPTELAEAKKCLKPRHPDDKQEKYVRDKDVYERAKKAGLDLKYKPYKDKRQRKDAQKREIDILDSVKKYGVTPHKSESKPVNDYEDDHIFDVLIKREQGNKRLKRQKRRLKNTKLKPV